MNWKEEIENNPYRFLSGSSLDGDEFSLNKEEIKSFIQSTLREELEEVVENVRKKHGFTGNLEWYIRVKRRLRWNYLLRGVDEKSIDQILLEANDAYIEDITTLLQERIKELDSN